VSNLTTDEWEDDERTEHVDITFRLETSHVEVAREDVGGGAIFGEKRVSRVLSRERKEKSDLPNFRRFDQKSRVDDDEGNHNEPSATPPEPG